MHYLFNKTNFAKQITIWQKKYQVLTPTKQGKDFIWQELTDPDKSIIPATTILPPKQFYFPPKESLFSFIGNKIQTNLIVKPIILLGLNNVDLKALRIFNKAMNSDYYYQKRKNSVILIGYGPKPASNHFDLFIVPDAESYHIYSNSQIGKNIINNTFCSIIKQSNYDEASLSNHEDPLFTNLSKLSYAVKKSINDKLWDKLAEICLGCGNCSYVCPLCYCFTVDDEIDLDNKKCPSSCQLCSGKRVRYWDSCFSPNFSLIAGGHNFRGNLRDRIYNWYHHKFVRFPQEFGIVGCVNCGRCIKYCPAKINYRKVLEEVLVKYSQ